MLSNSSSDLFFPIYLLETSSKEFLIFLLLSMAFCNFANAISLFNSTILSFASLYFFAVSACFLSFESLSLLSNNISSSLAKFLLSLQVY